MVCQNANILTRSAAEACFFLRPGVCFSSPLCSCLLFLAFAFNKLPMRGLTYGKMIACGMLGFFDVLFLYFSVKMLLARPSPLVVTTTGIKMPVIQPGFSSHNVYVAFDEMDDMLEYWHKDTVQMLKLKTARGVLHLNLFLMQAAHFEELRRLLWRRVHANRRQDSRTQVTGAEERQAVRIVRPKDVIVTSDVVELGDLNTNVKLP